MKSQARMNEKPKTKNISKKMSSNKNKDEMNEKQNVQTYTNANIEWSRMRE